MKSWLAVCLMFALQTPQIAQTQTQDEAALIQAGQQLARQGNGRGALPCMTCHGLEGAGSAVANFPRLQGLTTPYLAKQLRDYQQDLRASAVMQTAINSLTEAEIQAVAAWYGSQTSSNPVFPPVVPAQPNPDQLAEGERLANQGEWRQYLPPCQSCHGPGNRGAGSAFPSMAGQHAGYLQQQLLAWQSGQRRNDPNQLMLVITQRLSPEQIEAVAHYLASLDSAGE